jgi:hypothetical protein
MDLYDNINDCKQASITWTDYDKYKENYNVCDSWEEITNKLINTYNKSNIHNNTKNIPEYYKQSKNAIQNSLYYMFYKFGACYYIRIRNGNLHVFSYIWNPKWENEHSNILLIDPKYYHKYKKSNKKKWGILGSLIRVYEKKYEGYGMDFYYSETKYLIQKLCEEYKMPDCDFIVANKDNLVIKKDLTEPNEEVVGSINKPLNKKYKFKEYCPIFSYCYNERYGDLPFPTPDDILRIFKLYPAGKCINNYLPFDLIPWKDRISSAVFRGSFTGSSSNIYHNPRLHIALLNSQWKYNSKYNEKNNIDGIRYLDAGISSNVGKVRGRKEINDKSIRFVDSNYWKQLLVEPLSHQEQSKYKYILYIEGNVSAYRGAFLFSMGCVVLWVKSHKYKLWFEPHLKDMVNCIIINNDLSNLEEKITWLKQNDKKAEEIANNGLEFYNLFLTKKPILEYTYNLIVSSCNG